MKLIFLFLFLISSSLFAQNAESDLQNPVIDITKIQREEWDEIPTLEEVPIEGEPKNAQEKEDSPSKSLEKAQENRVWPDKSLKR